jgi:predicted TIM-barrel fold metal-dependent hydrolase
VVPIEDVQTSIRMMAEAKQLGLVATLVPPVLRERNLDHPDLEPFWAAAADLDMPLGVHAPSTCRRSASTGSRTTSRCTA